MQMKSVETFFFVFLDIDQLKYFDKSVRHFCILININSMSFQSGKWCTAVQATTNTIIHCSNDEFLQWLSTKHHCLGKKIHLEGINVLYNKMQFYWIWIYESSYWNKRDLNQLLPENNKDLKGHYERFEFFFLSTIRDLTN